ncbi:MAG TPA: hypothetical protein VFS77_00145 [Pyrinomonadaceae bacterium]|nr:hypothetical protein [Pyrinomonadaceae bacterium]
MSAIIVRAQEQAPRIGYIEFFGTSGIELQKVKDSLAAYEGQELSFAKLPHLRAEVSRLVQTPFGKEPTDVAPVCCDNQGRWILFVGLQGKNYRTFSYNPAPRGTATLPTHIVDVYRQAMDLIFESIRKGAIEDRSKGYALSTYPPLRAKQLAMREYAVSHAGLIRRVLLEAADAEQRTVAAALLGYANQNNQQITSLIRASRDPNDGVRNNAVRALVVLAEASRITASKIPAAPFVSMLNSGIWTDRNKTSYLLSYLTNRRDEKLFRLIQEQAIESLIEMARWQNPGHADTSRRILGHLAGIPEDQLQKLIAEQKVEEIVAALMKKRTD